MFSFGFIFEAFLVSFFPLFDFLNVFSPAGYFKKMRLREKLVHVFERWREVFIYIENVTCYICNSISIADPPYSPLFNRINFWFSQGPNGQLNGPKFFSHQDVQKDEIVRDQGKFWFVTLRMIYVTYVTVNSGNPLLQECYTSHMVVLNIQILQSGKPVFWIVLYLKYFFL